jgi:hypothetical protein
MTREITPPEAIAAPAAAQLYDAQRDPKLQAGIDAARDSRQALAEDLRKLGPFVPQARDPDVQAVYETVEAYERQLAAPHLLEAEYEAGTAECEDHTFVSKVGIVGHGVERLLLEAQHATEPYKRATQSFRGADHGTAGLAMILTVQHPATVIIPRGRQTGNGNVDPDHPVKAAIGAALAGEHHGGFLSLHGCFPGKMLTVLDDREVHAVIGLGKEPREASFVAAERLVRQARSLYGLRLIIGNLMPHLNQAEDPSADPKSFWNLGSDVKRDKDNNPATSSLAAKTPDSTVDYVTRETPAAPNMPSLQIEISRSLRLTPRDRWVRPDKQAEKVGVYMGYCLAELAAETVLQA